MRVGYCIIATNVYVDYAKKLIKSIDQNGSEFAETSVFIFSDNPKVFKRIGVKNLLLYSIKIPSYGWPEVANFRYKIFYENRAFFESCDVLIYTDADQFVHQIPTKTIREIFLSRSIGLVEHSGFWRYYYKAAWFTSMSKFMLAIGLFNRHRNLRRKIISEISKNIVLEKSRQNSSVSIPLLVLRFGLLALRPFSTLKFLIGKAHARISSKEFNQPNATKSISTTIRSHGSQEKRHSEIVYDSHVERIRPIKINLNLKFRLILQIFQDPIGYSHWNNFGNLFTHLNWRNRGTWETRNTMMAFTPVKNRGQYFCGGVWLGEKNAFLLLCKTLAEWTEMDLAAGYQAGWFDESYINAYAAFVPKFTALPPSWNWSARYPWLSELDKYIELVEKPDVLPIPER